MRGNPARGDRNDGLPDGDPCDVEPATFERSPWTVDCEAVVLNEDAVNSVAASAPNSHISLEVDLAKDVIRVWSERSSSLGSTTRINLSRRPLAASAHRKIRALGGFLGWSPDVSPVTCRLMQCMADLLADCLRIPSLFPGWGGYDLPRG